MTAVVLVRSLVHYNEKRSDAAIAICALDLNTRLGHAAEALIYRKLRLPDPKESTNG